MESFLGKTKVPLFFDEHGEFRMLVISDIQQKERVTKRTIETIERLLDKASPSLIILNGDNGWGMNDENVFRKYLAEIVEPFEKRAIPWCHVFGNHDSEELPTFGLFSLERTKLMEIYKSFPYCITKDSEEGVYGVGNCVLPVYDGDVPKFLVWLLDSNNRMDEIREGIWQAAYMPSSRMPWEIGYFSFLRHSQIHWYYETSRKIEETYGEKIPGHMFFHIPLPELAIIIDHPEETKRVGMIDATDFGPSLINSGLFSAIIERDDIKALFFGHDHANTFSGEYCGITMGYCGSLYPCDTDFPTCGARLITVEKAHPEIVKTEYIYANELDD